MALFLTGFDALLCAVILLAALDYLRAVFFMDQPLVCLAFYLVVIGAFGHLVTLYAGRVPSLWEVLLHLGVTLYALAHYPDIFVDAWRWDGKERRQPELHRSGAPGPLGTPRPPRGRR